MGDVALMQSSVGLQVRPWFYMKCQAVVINEGKYEIDPIKYFKQTDFPEDHNLFDALGYIFK